MENKNIDPILPVFSIDPETHEFTTDNRCFHDSDLTYFPGGENDEPECCGVKEGYYTGNAIVKLQRDHKNNPETIQYIADMLET